MGGGGGSHLNGSVNGFHISGNKLYLYMILIFKLDKEMLYSFKHKPLKKFRWGVEGEGLISH